MGAESVQFLRCNMKKYEDMDPTDLAGAVATDCSDGEEYKVDYANKFVCLECISDMDMSFETWSKPHTKCPRCGAKTTLYKAINRRVLK